MTRFLCASGGVKKERGHGDEITAAHFKINGCLCCRQLVDRLVVQNAVPVRARDHPQCPILAPARVHVHT